MFQYIFMNQLLSKNLILYLISSRQDSSHSSLVLARLVLSRRRIYFPWHSTKLDKKYFCSCRSRSRSRGFEHPEDLSICCLCLFLYIGFTLFSSLPYMEELYMTANIFLPLHNTALLVHGPQISGVSFWTNYW